MPYFCWLFTMFSCKIWKKTFENVRLDVKTYWILTAAHQNLTNVITLLESVVKIRLQEFDNFSFISVRGSGGESGADNTSATIVISKIKIPPYVIVGQTVHLYCLFELRNGTDLYTLKWFKDGAEFYRSVPRASVRKNRRLIFPMPGVRVDFENSKVKWFSHKPSQISKKKK